MLVPQEKMQNMAGAGVVGPGFPKGRGENLLFGKNVVPKLHENEGNYQGGEVSPSVYLPMCRIPTVIKRRIRGDTARLNFDISFKQQSLHRPHIPQLKQHAQVVQHA